jgi:ketosteroid isomerase-like protein
MSTENERLAREGYEALMHGEIEVVEQLMAPDLTWHWWEHGPWECQSRDEAMAVIKERMGQRAIGEMREVVELDDERVLVVMGLRTDSEITPEALGLPKDHDEVANVVTFRDGKVIAMQDYRSKAEALAAVKGEGTGG